MLDLSLQEVTKLIQIIPLSMGRSRMMTREVQQYPLLLCGACTVRRAHSVCAIQLKEVRLQPLMEILDARELSELSWPLWVHWVVSAGICTETLLSSTAFKPGTQGVNTTALCSFHPALCIDSRDSGSDPTLIIQWAHRAHGSGIPGELWEFTEHVAHS